MILNQQRSLSLPPEESLCIFMHHSTTLVKLKFHHQVNVVNYDIDKNTYI
jgi:hypothetical protein